MANLAALKNRLREIPNKVMDTAERKVYIISEESAARMVEIINTSGTGWVGRGAEAFAEGRVDSGQMRRDVGFTVERSGTRITAKMGWVHGQDPYYLEQEYGFINPWTGAPVPPMLALTQASADFENKLKVMKL